MVLLIICYLDNSNDVLQPESAMKGIKTTVVAINISLVF